MENKTYIYDIYLDDECVWNYGEEVFDTEEDAKADAKDLINDYLKDEYNRPAEDFEIAIFESCDE